MLTPLAFRVVGGADNRREVVSYRKALVAYAHADPAARPDLPAFLSAYAFPATLRDHVNNTGSTRGYDGAVGVPYLHFDLDRLDLDAALHDARRLASYLADRFAADLVIAFSGSKGFHIDLPTAGIVEASTDAHTVAKGLACRIAGEVGVDIDTGIYDRVRLFRAPNTPHHRTSLRKVRIDLDDLLYIDAYGVRKLAVEPIPFDPPSPPVPCERLQAAWCDAQAEVRQTIEATRERRREASRRPSRINPLTRLLLSDPTAIRNGERHDTIFSAAADLAEFASVDDLIAALLTDPALDTGLPPREVERQIRCGIEHARRHREGGAA